MIRMTQSATATSTLANGRTSPARSREPQEGLAALIHSLINSCGSTPEVPRAIGVTSCRRGAGVSTVSANLALAAAECLPGPVLLVEANFSRPSMGQLFGLRNAPGLREILCGEANPYSAPQSIGYENIALVTAGASAGSRPPAITTAAIRNLLEVWRQDFSLILFDLPAADGSDSRVSIASGLDGVVLVIEPGHVSSRAAQRAQTLLQQYRAKILGVVFNKQSKPAALSYTNGSSHGRAG